MRTAIALLIGTVYFGLPREAAAIPAFARQTGVSCALCHRAYPELTAVGKDFAGRGFMLGELPPGEHVPTGDKKLTLWEQFPIAFRFQGDIVSRPDTRKQPDIQIPVVAKLFSGAAISRYINYYAYFLLAERGDVGGLEDAWVTFHDAPIEGLGLQVGQFQIMDVTFPRELRLTRQDFLIYTVPQSDTGFRLTYQRGANLSYEVGPAQAVLGLVNGNGIGPGQPGPAYPGRNNPIFDNDIAKIGYARLGVEFWGITTGLFGLKGAEGREEVANRMWRFGPDIEYVRGPFRVFVQYLMGTDDNPTLALRDTDPDSLRLHGGFAGASWLLTDRWALAALYNHVVSERHDRNARIGTANASYYWRRNVKVGLEGNYDFIPDRSWHPFKEHSVIAFVDFAY